MQAMWSLCWKHKVQLAAFSSLPDEIVPKKVGPQRVAARRQQQLLCVMALQKLGWHALDDAILRVML